MSTLSLNQENHMERDPRLDLWSIHGLGARTHPTEEWVNLLLSVKFEVKLPRYLYDMYERAQACIVYGCYHYPLFTLGTEELFRFSESALREAVKEAGASKSVQQKRFRPLIEWAHKNGYLTESAQSRWQASRELRNSTSHKDGPFLVGPNDALMQLSTSVELAEALFLSVRSSAQGK